MLHDNKCDACGKLIENDEEMVALIFVKATNKRKDGKIRIKISDRAIEQRIFRLFCQNCIKINNFIIKDGV